MVLSKQEYKLGIW